ncbi:hypothetical protein P3S68_003107 [Capsicum galapagoense]
MDQTKSQENESLKQEIMSLRQQMTKMYRVWESGLPPPPFPTTIDPANALKSIPSQKHPNASITHFLALQHKPTTLTVPHTAYAFVAQPSIEASTLAINPMVVLLQAASEYMFNTLDDHCYIF